jgi:hypothetical protein
MKILTCGVCGERAPGKQHWNHDAGFGLCPRCAYRLAADPREHVRGELLGYGTPGVNYAAPLSDACDPGMLVAWHTLADDGEFHGWHVGTLKEWDNGTAIVRTADGREKAVQG